MAHKDFVFCEVPLACWWSMSALAFPPRFLVVNNMADCVFPLIDCDCLCGPREAVLNMVLARIVVLEMFETTDKTNEAR